MATIKQYKYRWRNPITGVIEGATASNSLTGKIIKAGIQAPPGTKLDIYLNNETYPFEVLIGKNGILELEYDNIIINKIVIKSQQKFIRDQVEEIRSREAALAAIKTAIETYNSKEQQQNLETVQTLATTITTQYINFYQAVQGKYINDAEIVKVENVLIDYIEED